MSSTPERRRHPRVPVSWPIRLWVDDEPLLGRAEDASRNGLWVTVPSTTALRLGKICWVDVLSDELGSFTVAGEVRHVNGRRIGLETTRPVPLAGLEPA
ncbi:MAG TPA: PilZ domain-containing protein [Methylomirabilota bacterium]|jgi:PilZ domain|nr:PilZ domain-containing protein [Methylomirabilota bacterium]